MARVQISIDDSVLAKVDDAAKSMALSRSAFFSMAALDYIEAKRKAPLLSGAFSSLAQLFDQRVRGDISEDEFQLRIDGIEDSVKRLK